MEGQQISLIYELSPSEMYDGYIAIKTGSIRNSCGTMEKFKKGDIIYILYFYEDKVSISNSLDIEVEIPRGKFDEYFKYLGKKAYPKEQPELWAGKGYWIPNPRYKKRGHK